MLAENYLDLWPDKNTFTFVTRIDLGRAIAILTLTFL